MIKRLFFFLIVALFLLTACSENDSFTTDRSHRLTFTTDTVRMDTLFATVPSATYTFWVHNQSGDGLRLRSVRLERSGQSGFRANVDGSYLNPVVNNLEIREGDSIRVFVEVTAFENQSPDPQLVEDNLLFTLESEVEQRVNLRTYSWNAEQWQTVDITSDRTIESATPIVVYGGINVAEGAALAIKNTTIYFHDGAGINVKGALYAENCVFRGDRLDHMFDYLPYDRVSGQWQGITVEPHATSCLLVDSELRNAMDGIVADTTVVVLSGSTIHNCKGFGLWAHDCVVDIQYSTLSNTLKDCLTLLGCQSTLNHVTLAQFYPFYANRGAALHIAPTKQEFSLTCTNTLATGYDDDVLMGEVDEKSECSFENCLLRTPEPDATEQQYFKDIIWEKKDDEIQGKKHFVLVDEDNLIYDFRLKEESPAYEKKIGNIQ
jgi:hypothetical protein